MCGGKRRLEAGTESSLQQLGEHMSEGRTSWTWQRVARVAFLQVG